MGNPQKTNTEKVKKNQNINTSKQVVQSLIPKKNSKLNDQNENDIIIENGDSNYLIDQLINSAYSNLGLGYRGGGTNKDGFDCSGLMYSTFKKYDITLPRSSHEMAELGHKIDLDKEQFDKSLEFIIWDIKKFLNTPYTTENNV